MRLGDSDHVPPAASHLLTALIGDDAEEPRPDRAAGTHAAELSPGADTCLLYRVLREIGVLKQRGGETVSRFNEGRKDGLKSSDVATLGVDDELLLRVALHNFTLNTGGEAQKCFSPLVLTTNSAGGLPPGC